MRQLPALTLLFFIMSFALNRAFHSPLVGKFLGPRFRGLKRLNAQYSSTAPFESASDGSSGPVFVSYNVYKGKAALSVKPIPPTVQRKGAGVRLVKEGALLLEISPSSGANGNSREYDWSKKQFFALTLAEMGELATIDKTKGLEFFHDPNLGSPDQGKVAKKLKITPGQDGKVMFLSLTINEKSGGSGSLNVPLTMGELEVIRSMVHTLIPKFLALDLVTPRNEPSQ